jgi:hypothetical protein
MTVIKTIIRDRRIDVPAPNDMPDGMEVILTIGTSVPDDETMPPEEIARVWSCLHSLQGRSRACSITDDRAPGNLPAGQ